MNGMIKRLMVVMLAVIMVFGMVITPAEAKSGKGRKPQPTPEPTVEPDVPETPAPEEEVTEETEEPAEEIPAEEAVSEQEEPAEEEVIVTETEEPAAEEASAAEEEPAEEIVLDAQPFDANAFARTLAVNATGETRAAEDVSINAGKTVTDADGDGIYELALSVKATSDTSSSANVTKSNVVMVIDVSGSMNYSTFTQYTYGADTYSSSNTYYNSTSVNNNNQANGTRVYYNAQRGNWYTTQNPNNGSQPYTGTVYQAESRLAATKRAANAVVDALLAYNTNADNITDIFEITVVKFAERTAHDGYNGTQEIVSHSNNADTIKNAINNLSAGGGTHWRAALEQALTSANWYKNNQDSSEKTSVIFLTDGFPTERGTGNDGGSESNENVSRGYLDARTPARNIVQAGYTLYGIFAFGSDTTTHGNTSGQYNTGSHTGFEFLRGLTNYAYSNTTTNNFNETDVTRQYDFNARSTDELVAAFKTIIDHITNNVGFAGVNLSDGVSLGATSTSVAVNGTAKADTMRYTVTDASGKISYTVKFNEGTANFTIYNADGSTSTASDSEAETVTTNINGTVITSKVYSVTVDGKTYEMSPATIDANTGMVKWDLAGLGILESGYTYTVAFDVWPNQLAYDIAADLNNGLYANVDAALDAYKVTDATERQHIKDAIVHNADGSYSLYTNYSQEIEYYPATSETDDEGNVNWTYGDKLTQTLPNPDPIPLKGSLLPMEKKWDSDLSQSEMDELLWKDGEVGGTSNEYQITLYVWKADTENELDQKINTGVTEENQPYITEVLGWDTTASVYDWAKDIAVAPGTMVNIAEAEILGFDITDETKIREFTNDEGQKLTYYVIESGHYYYVTEEGADLHYELETVLYHPMIVDGKLYNVAFGEGKTVEKMDPMESVIATNTLKGGLNISKVVSTTQITVIDGAITGVSEPVENGLKTTTDEFTFEIKLWKVDDEGNKSAVYTYDDQIDAEKNQTISGSIGYRVFSEPSAIDEETGNITYGKQLRGAILTEDSEYADLAGSIFATIANNETKLVLTMPANGEIRLVNLPAGTQYTVREIVDEGGSYTYAATESAVTPVKEGDKAVVSTGNEVSGSISGNKANIETYYNCAASFYVYHSSDNTIEKISIADNRVEGTYDSETGYSYSFNIVDETKSGYLYGGYFQAYSGVKMTDAQIIAAQYENTDSATYTYKEKEKATSNWITDTGATPYTGSVSTAWKAKQAYTEAGNAMEPAINTVYYLKEVPEEYFTPGIYYVYDDRAEGKPLKKLYLLVPTDDGNYTGVGSVDDTPAALTTKLYTSYKITNDATGVSETKKAQDINEVPRGYLTVWDVRDLITAGGSYEWTPKYTTKDGITVTGAQKRTIVIGNGCFDAETTKKYTEEQSDVEAFYVYDTMIDSTYSAE